MQTRRAAWRRLPTRLPRRPAPANPAFPLSPGRQDRALELGSRLWGYLKHGPPRTQRQGGLPGQQPRGAWQIATLAVAVPKDAPLLPRTLPTRSAQGRGVSPSQPARQPSCSRGGPLLPRMRQLPRPHVNQCLLQPRRPPARPPARPKPRRGAAHAPLTRRPPVPGVQAQAPGDGETPARGREGALSPRPQREQTHAPLHPTTALAHATIVARSRCDPAADAGESDLGHLQFCERLVALIALSH